MPSPQRGDSRLLVVDRCADALTDARFASLPTHLRSGDLVVINRSRVLPARLRGQRPGGGAAEVLLVRREGDWTWQAMLRPARRLKPGIRIDVAPDLDITVLDGPTRADGCHSVRLHSRSLTEQEVIQRHGLIPLPPYIAREADMQDRERYQTIFAREEGSVAAPTAGLHFTPSLLDELRAQGIGLAELVLHVGPATFQPIRDQNVAGHRLSPEQAHVPKDTAVRINQTRLDGGRVVAVGTTVTRTLESAASEDGLVQPGTLEANLFITPGYRFKIVDALITNFHLPRSSLLVLVSAFAGRERILRAYDHAIRAGYRFYSYGDACLIL